MTTPTSPTPEQGIPEDELARIKKDANYAPARTTWGEKQSYIEGATAEYLRAAKLSQTKPSPPLRWVKASERLPKEEGKYPCKQNGEYFTKYLGSKYKGDMTLEWLEDPSESPSPDISISEDENKYTLKDLKESWEAAEIWALNGPYSKNYKGETIRQNPDFQTYFKSKQK